MKKRTSLFFALLLAMLLVFVSACGGEGRTIIQNPTGTLIIENGTSEFQPAEGYSADVPGSTAAAIDSRPATTDGPQSADPAPAGAEAAVTPSAAASVNFKKYSDPSGYFTMELPEGWAVSVGLKPTGLIDLISYAITAYDPAVPERMLYFNLNTSGMVKSQEAHDWYVNTYGAQSLFAQSPIVTSLTTEGFFEGMGEWYGYSGFTALENLGPSVLGGDIVSARATSGSGTEFEGLFTTTLFDMPFAVQRNPFNYMEGTIDAGIITAYDVIMETAPTEEFTSWAPVLDRILGSIEFTQAFMTQRQQAWAQVNQTSQYIMDTANQISDIIMDSWESSSRTYDVISQKEHDNIMGYDRIYDTEKGEYYQADSGFLDGYTGNRYELVTDDAGFLAPVSGIINWK